MRRVNPFEEGERNNFPNLSPLKPANEFSYGSSDGDNASSYSEDMEVFEDDFEDDGDLNIDAGGSESDEHNNNNNIDNGAGKEKKNIDLNWSIEALSTLKPTEIS